MSNYELKYDGEGIRALRTLPFSGKVFVSIQDGIEIHELRVKNVRVAEFKRKEGEAEGETISYIDGCRKIGTGNLLAGVLLRLAQIDSKSRIR
jgi:hypothetical protein